jgi:hypothetical protein
MAVTGEYRRRASLTAASQKGKRVATASGVSGSSRPSDAKNASISAQTRRAAAGVVASA